MSDLDAIAEHPGHLPPWLDWLLSNTQMGLLVLNPDTRVVFVNKWLLVRAGLSFEQVNGRHRARPGPCRNAALKIRIPDLLAPPQAVISACCFCPCVVEVKIQPCV